MLRVMVVGLGYVGLPIALSFAEKYETYGFDIDKNKIANYKKGIDINKQFNYEDLKNTKIKFTNNPKDINKTDFVIITVPTPIDSKNNPDLYFLKSATEIVSKNIKEGATIIYESTVYPGTTEEICIPIIEKVSKMQLNKNFFVGYSPERINPGDKKHKFENITKIVSGSNEETTNNIANLYQKCLENKVIKVSSIKVAEASKIIENSQRDINIAFINEVSKILHSMNINTQEVLNAARTKWNFLDFRPGLVGGHCIGVDPYYLSYKAKKIGVNPEVILAGRKINDTMSMYIVENLEKILKENNIEIKDAKVLVKGITFKENISDIRNSKAIDIVKELKHKGMSVYIEDYNVNEEELNKAYNLTLKEEIPKVNVVILAVKHDKYCKMTIKDLNDLFEKRNNKKIVFDLHSIFNKEKLEKGGFIVWNL